MLTSNPCDPAEGERRGGTVGFALPGVGVRVRDDAGAPNARGRRSAASRCAARTCSRAIGACPKRRVRNSPPTAGSRPATSARSMSRGYVSIVGRSKDLIITGGYNVYPAEIEALHQRNARRGRERGDRRATPGLRRRRASRSWSPDRGSRIDTAALDGRAEVEDRQLQDAEAVFVVPRTAAQRHGQGAEEAAARAAQGLFAAPSW